MNSTHKAEVITVNMDKHDNADSLSLVKAYDYVCIVNTEIWKDTKKAAYICPDSLVDTTRPEFSFFATEKRLYEIEGRRVYYRIKAKKIRGVVSFGFLVPVPEEIPIGEDWADKLGIIHFDEEVHTTTKQKGVDLSGGEVETPPNCYFVKYDVDSLRRYRNLFDEGELCYITCKAHGCNARYVYHNDKMYCGSRGEWKREYATPPEYDKIAENMRRRMLENSLEPIDETILENRLLEIKTKIDNWNPSQNVWWKVLRQSPNIEKFCKENEGTILYGELVGTQGGFSYGCKPGEVAFYAFDILKTERWLDSADFIKTCDEYQIKRVPIIENNYPFNFEKVCEMAEGPSLFVEAKHIREGCVVKPIKERYDSKIGRVCLKVVGAGYLELK